MLTFHDLTQVSAATGVLAPKRGVGTRGGLAGAVGEGRGGLRGHGKGDKGDLFLHVLLCKRKWI